jgi:hypothetical protein
MVPNLPHPVLKLIVYLYPVTARGLETASENAIIGFSLSFWSPSRE